MGTFMVQLGVMSLQASMAVLVVLLLRKVFFWCGISKKYAALLWLIPFLLLICPWKISSPVGIFSSAPSDYDSAYAEETFKNQEKFLGDVEIGIVEAELNEPEQGDITGAESDIINEKGSQEMNMSEKQNVLIPIYSWQKFWIVITVVWFDGMLLFFVYAVISYLRLKRRVRVHIQRMENVYSVDELAVPMVLGLIKPHIYLPSGMDEVHIPYVVAHENTHIRRRDPFFKFVAYMITCVHWFNPVVWLAYFFMEKDMEMACDEETIQTIGVEKKKEYATALLQLATGKRMIFAVPLAFGEGDTKRRIKNVMTYKKTVKAAAVLAVATGVLVFLVFMTKESGNSYTAVLTNPGGVNSTLNLGDEQAALDQTLKNEQEELLLEEEIAKQQELLAEMEAKEAETKAEIEARREESEKQVLITKINQESELTFGMVRQAMEKHILHELDFVKFSNGENLKEEATYSLNYYIDFYFVDDTLNPQGEEYRLGVSLWKEDDSLADIYITRMSDMDMRWLYSAEKDEYRDVLEEFLATKENVTDWLSVELPDGYTLGNYNANYGYEGGALILPQAYEVYGEDVFAPADWYHAGCISRMPEATTRYEFVDGKLQPHRGVPWNHTSAEFVEVLKLDWQAILMEVNHDLYTAAGMGWLEEDGIDTTQIATTSDYWYFFFVKEGEDTCYYLSLAKNCFTKEEAIAIAETVEIYN